MSFPSLARTTPAKRSLSHLLLSGYNPLAPPVAYSSNSTSRQSNPSLRPINFSNWLGSVGQADDVAQGWHIVPKCLAAGQGHLLAAYRTGDGNSRVFSVGRNEAGQLGIGYASQEGTRGMVEGFRGEAILQAAASCQSSYLVLSGEDRDALYVFGNLSRGRLAQPAHYPPADLEEHEDPTLHMLARATPVHLPPELERIRQIAVGFEHILVLSENGEIWGAGCNTDGQLGLGDGELSDVYQMTKMELPHEVIKQGGPRHIQAGADTSALITESGQIWTWGNSEYAQAMHSRKIDQIHTPMPIDDSFLPSSRRLVDFRCGGSFSLALDDQGSVYSAGFGALGRGPDTLESQFVRRIDALEGTGVNRIRSGWGWAAAVRDSGSQSSIYTWGLNNEHGRLGLGTIKAPRTAKGATGSRSIAPSHIYEPREIELPLRELGLTRGDSNRDWHLGEIECGENALWVDLTDLDPPPEAE